MPSSTEMLATKPLAYLTMSRIDTSTSAEMPMPVRSAYLGLGSVGTIDRPLGTGGRAEPGEVTSASHLAYTGSTMAGAVGPTGLPKIQLMPTRIRLMPMTVMMVPVTTGGKKRSMRLTIGAIRIEMMPAPMIEPNSSCAPAVPAVGVGDGDHRRDGREGHAHHHRQPDAEPLGGAQRLDQRGDAAAEQVGRDQQRHFLRAELERAADDQRHRDGAGVHHQHVLQAEGGQLAGRAGAGRRDERPRRRRRKR